MLLYVISACSNLCVSQSLVVGADVHRLVADGWPVENVVATDLYAGENVLLTPSSTRLISSPFRVEYWRRGHNLFRTTPETFPATFVPGDIFSGELFDINAQAIEKPPLPLSSLTSLTPLKGHVSAIHASSFFHLFSEERQKILCRIVDALLSPEPGSIAFGNQLGAADGKENGSTEGSTGLGFRHSEASWKKMWVEAVGEGKFEVMARVVQLPDLKAREGLIRSNDSHVYWMMWAVKRV
jgi:hypothetical protein